MVLWLRICLPMLGARVRSLVRELGSHMSQGNEAHVPQLERGSGRAKEESLHATTRDPVAAK